MRYLTLASFKHHNPSWDVRVYQCQTAMNRTWATGEMCDAVDYAGPDYLSLVKNLGVEFESVNSDIVSVSPSFACDLWSYRHLATVGGWYADMDILWVKPMPELTADVVVCHTCSVIGIGFLAGMPGCPVWRDVHRHARASYNPRDYQACGVTAMQRCFPSVPVARKKYTECSIISVPDDTVYPWNHTQTSCIFDESRSVPDRTIGIHWFGGHPNSQIWNNRITRENIGQFNNTFTRYAEKLKT